jgi:aquaporin TIP
LKKYIAEFIAAFFLVFAGTAAIVADQTLAVVLVRDSFGLLGVALAHGLALAVVIAAIGGISGGHANPAVSIAFYISRRLSAKDLGGYIAAQLLGGLVAAFLVARVFVAEAVEATGVGVPALGPGTALLQGGLIEVILTFMLVFVIWGVAVNPKGAKIIAPLAIGLTYSFGVIIGGPFTGAAMNPARWFGPALVSGQFANWPVWILGPIVGALLASTVYELFFLEEAEMAPEADEDLAPRAPEILPGGEPAEDAVVAERAEDTVVAAGAESEKPAADSDA